MKYNESKNFLLKRDSVDWSQLRVIFISPSFITYQRKVIEFKDLPIGLIEIKKLTSGLISSAVKEINIVFATKNLFYTFFFYPDKASYVGLFVYRCKLKTDKNK